jgi:phage-related protein
MAYPYALHKWEAEKAYAIGDVVRADPAKDNTLAFKCVVAGTTDTLDTYATFPNQEPSFPFKITQELVDGTCTWQAFEPLAEELLRLAPTAVIDLFEVYLTPKINDGPKITLYYHAGKNGLTEDIKFGGQTYPAVPVEIDGFEFSGRGTLPRPTLKVANVNNAITTLMLTYNPLGAKVQRIRTFAKFIDTTNFNQQVPFAVESDVADALTTETGDSLIMQTFNDTADENAKIVETWYIDRVSGENQQFVEFELAPKIDLVNISLPRRTIEEFCPWEYRGTECGYEGDECFTVNDSKIAAANKIVDADGNVTNDICGKKLSSCKKRFGNNVDLPYGGFYGARLQA